MNRLIASGVRIILSCGAALLITACSFFGNGSYFEYVVYVANYGKHGVILRDFHVVEVGADNNGTWGIDPGFPGVADDFERFEHFVGYPHSLPETLVVTWQLAEMRDCESI